MTRIRVLQVPDCPLVADVLRDVEVSVRRAGLDERIEVVVGDFPSPTVVVDGRDITTGQPPAGAPQCRMDRPSVKQIDTAITGLNVKGEG